MRIGPHQIESRLERQLDPVYYVAGSENLLVDETCLAVIEAARANGYTEMKKLELNRKCDDLLMATVSSSLFSDKQIVDARMSGTSFDRNGSKVIQNYLKQPDEDTVLLIRGRTYEYQHQRAAWFKVLANDALVVIAESPKPEQIPAWITERCRRAGIRIERDAIDYLADCSEGNLYNAQQEIEKLKLAFLNREETIKRSDLAVLDSSKGNTFELIDQACLGNAERAQKILTALQREGVYVGVPLGALTAQLRRIHAFVLGKSQHMTQYRRRCAEAAARRLRRTGIEDLLVECALIDSQIKGISHGDPWLSLENVVLALSGKAVSKLDTNSNLYTIDHEV